MKGPSYTIPEELTAEEWGREGQRSPRVKKQEKKFFFNVRKVRQFWMKYTEKLNVARNLEMSTWAASGMSWNNRTGEILFEGRMLG